MLKIKVIYSRSNQLISYKHIEDIIKATKGNKKQTTVQVIEGGHDAHTDNPDALH